MSELLQTHVGWQLNKRIDSVDQLDLDDYWDLLDYNTNIFEMTLWMDFLRQWIIILCTISLSMLFIFSLLRLRKTQNGCDID